MNYYRSQKQPRSSHLKKSGYIFALVDIQDICDMKGERILDTKVFIIPRSHTNETVALLAIQVETYRNMLLNSKKDNDNILNVISQSSIEDEKNRSLIKTELPPGIFDTEDISDRTIYVSNDKNPVDMAVTLHHIKMTTCEYILEMRKHPFLQYVQDVNKLYTKYCSKLVDILDHLISKNWNNQYILLNIEPRGYGKYEKIYPGPLITLPGGTMEIVDENDFEVCAFREFCEETNINIDNAGYICIGYDKCMYQKPCLSFSSAKVVKHIFYIQQCSIYFCIQLLNPEIKE
jgi:hypothetical protein